MRSDPLPNLLVQLICAHPEHQKHLALKDANFTEEDARKTRGRAEQSQIGCFRFGKRSGKKVASLIIFRNSSNWSLASALSEMRRILYSLR